MQFLSGISCFRGTATYQSPHYPKKEPSKYLARKTLHNFQPFSFSSINQLKNRYRFSAKFCEFYAQLHYTALHQPCLLIAKYGQLGMPAGSACCQMLSLSVCWISFLPPFEKQTASCIKSTSHTIWMLRFSVTVSVTIFVIKMIIVAKLVKSGPFKSSMNLGCNQE